MAECRRGADCICAEVMGSCRQGQSAPLVGVPDEGFPTEPDNKLTSSDGALLFGITTVLGQVAVVVLIVAGYDPDGIIGVGLNTVAAALLTVACAVRR